MFEIWIDKRGFDDTFSVLKGEKKLHPLFVELKDYIEKEFDIKIYNVIFEKHSRFSLSKISRLLASRGKKYSFKCYVSSYSGMEKMQKKIPFEDGKIQGAFTRDYDREIQNKIIEKMYELNQKYEVKLPEDRKGICFDFLPWFPFDYHGYLFNKVGNSILKEIKEKYKDKAKIWNVSSMNHCISIFYEKDKDLKANDENGITNEIKELVVCRMKEVDELNMYDTNHLIFDSKENVDKNYGGNLFNYFK